MRIQDWLDFLESKAPVASAEPWDPVGLLVGDRGAKIRGVEVAIDLDAAILARASKNRSNLIVNHHPCIFPKSKKLGPITRQTMPLVVDALERGISVVACHTNFDRCDLEVGERVAKGLGFFPRGRLHEDGTETFEKVVVFVPKTHLEIVERAMFAAGAGHIGRYAACGFAAEGRGSFLPLEGASPFVGRVGELERVSELRLEVTVPKWQAEGVVKAMRSAHPYEEVAYDRYDLAQPIQLEGIRRGIGYGVWGEFERGISFSDLVSSVKKLFRLGGYLSGKPLRKRVRRVGFTPGNGSAFIESAHRLDGDGLDVLITGEVGYHKRREARARGLEILELGHAESECFFPVVMKSWLREFFEG